MTLQPVLGFFPPSVGVFWGETQGSWGALSPSIATMMDPELPAVPVARGGNYDVTDHVMGQDFWSQGDGIKGRKGGGKRDGASIKGQGLSV